MEYGFAWAEKLPCRHIKCRISSYMEASGAKTYPSDFGQSSCARFPKGFQLSLDDMAEQKMLRPKHTIALYRIWLLHGLYHEASGFYCAQLFSHEF